MSNNQNRSQDKDKEEEEDDDEPKFLTRQEEKEAFIRNPIDPQSELSSSTSPLAPFPGNALKWASNIYDDGTSYEGLQCFEVPHGLGIEVMGYAGGIEDEEINDRYEGEWHSGFKHGLGQQTSDLKNTLYQGEFEQGLKHGCGVLYDVKPLLQLIEKGKSATEAYKIAWPEIKEDAQYGTWELNKFVAEPEAENGEQYCSIHEIRAMQQEIVDVVKKARMFEWKPYGEVSLRLSQVEQNIPAPIMQNPTHYPMETVWMAPGPLGQCYPLPDDDKIRQLLRIHGEDHSKIHDTYNFDLVPEPGSEQWIAESYFEALANQEGFSFGNDKDRANRLLNEPKATHIKSKKDKSSTQKGGIVGYFERRKEYRRQQTLIRNQKAQEESSQEYSDDLYLSPQQTGENQRPGDKPYASIANQSISIVFNNQFFQQNHFGMLNGFVNIISQRRPRINRPISAHPL